MRKFISSALSGEPGIEVVGQAGDPYEARDKIVALKPDVMTLDIQMPKMDGIDFLARLMPQYPLPVVVVSAINSRVFDALNAGAVDFIHKAGLRDEKDRMGFASELIAKIKIASIARVGRYKHSAARKQVAGKPDGTAQPHCVIGIGASTGGTEATLGILKKPGERSAGDGDRTAHAAGIYTNVCAASE